MKKILFIAAVSGAVLLFGPARHQENKVGASQYSIAADLQNDTTPKKRKHRKDTTRRDTTGIAFVALAANR